MKRTNLVLEFLIGIILFIMMFFFAFSIIAKIYSVNSVDEFDKFVKAIKDAQEYNQKTTFYFKLNKQDKIYFKLNKDLSFTITLKNKDKVKKQVKLNNLFLTGLYLDYYTQANENEEKNEIDRINAYLNSFYIKNKDVVFITGLNKDKFALIQFYSDFSEEEKNDNKLLGININEETKNLIDLFDFNYISSKDLISTLDINNEFYDEKSKLKETKFTESEKINFKMYFDVLSNKIIFSKYYENNNNIVNTKKLVSFYYIPLKDFIVKSLNDLLLINKKNNEFDIKLKAENKLENCNDLEINDADYLKINSYINKMKDSNKRILFKVRFLVKDNYIDYKDDINKETNELELIKADDLLKILNKFDKYINLKCELEDYIIKSKNTEENKNKEIKTKIQYFVFDIDINDLDLYNYETSKVLENIGFKFNKDKLCIKDKAKDNCLKLSKDNLFNNFINFINRYESSKKINTPFDLILKFKEYNPYLCFKQKEINCKELNNINGILNLNCLVKKEYDDILKDLNKCVKEIKKNNNFDLSKFKQEKLILLQGNNLNQNYDDDVISNGKDINKIIKNLIKYNKNLQDSYILRKLDDNKYILLRYKYFNNNKLYFKDIFFFNYINEDLYNEFKEKFKK